MLAQVAVRNDAFDFMHAEYRHERYIEIAIAAISTRAIRASGGVLFTPYKGEALTLPIGGGYFAIDPSDALLAICSLSPRGPQVGCSSGASGVDAAMCMTAPLSAA